MASDSLDGLELASWQDRDWMPRKQRIWAKLEQQLLDLSPVLMSLPGMEQLPAEWTQQPPRIHKGENYHSYSYRSLDLLAFSRQSDLLIVRLLLLWGHPPALHLVARGQPREWFLERLTGCKLDGWHLDSGESPWEWFPFPPSAEAWNLVSERVLAANHPFFKLSCWETGADPGNLRHFATAHLGQLLAAVSAVSG